ncbi:MAG: hypothetical protein QHG94_05000 [Candidatus Methanosuratincola sp.]|nr:hypothetical protein [Candidatus Methanosuratincola sp.]
MVGNSAELGEVEDRVLRLMASDSQTRFSFQGMKRALKVHQERLSRGLSRLHSQGYIWKDNDGYLITPKGKRAAGRLGSGSKKIVVGTSYMPPGTGLQYIESQLKGRWFGGMRWLGASSEGDSRTLKWVSEDGDIQVGLNFGRDLLEVMLESFPPNEEARAREMASRLFVKIINAIYSRGQNQEN